MLVNMKKYQKYTRWMLGLTLVELLVCFCIMAILMSLAIPNFSQFIERQKLKTTVTEFYAAVNLTRSEAIKRGAQVSLITNDGVSWKSGWKIVVDENSNGVADAGEEIIFSHENLSEKFTILHNFTDAALPYISYTGHGRSRANASSQQPLAGTVSFMLGGNIKRIKVNFLGRARICDPTNDLTCGDTQTGT